jgi:OOP family OmpA-OmpF porin
VRLATSVITLVLVAAIAGFAQAQQKDDPKCKDHPMFTRMPNYWIHGCDVKEFDAYAFNLGKGKTQSVEGRKTYIRYYLQATATSRPSQLQVSRNYQNAVKALGGTLVSSEPGKDVFKIAKGGKEVWAEVVATPQSAYFLTIVEREEMKQDIEANAGVFMNDIRATGHAAVYGIYFDTGKTELKPESEQAIGEIAKLLGTDPALKLYVVGNTDNVGTLDTNMKLSQGRAEAVVAALTTTHGIVATRLRACGIGPLAPVAANEAEEGRAKNRRVELVRQ